MADSRRALAAAASRLRPLVRAAKQELSAATDATQPAGVLRALLPLAGVQAATGAPADAPGGTLAEEVRAVVRELGRDAVSEAFFDCIFPAFASYLLGEFCPAWLPSMPESERVLCFDSFFNLAPATEAFAALAHGLKEAAEDSAVLAAVVRLLEPFADGSAWRRPRLCDLCEEQARLDEREAGRRAPRVLRPEQAELAQALVSLPDRLSNRLRAPPPRSLQPRPYFAAVVRACLSLVPAPAEGGVGPGRPLSFAGDLAGRLARAGRGEALTLGAGRPEAIGELLRWVPEAAAGRAALALAASAGSRGEGAEVELAAALRPALEASAAARHAVASACLRSPLLPLPALSCLLRCLARDEMASVPSDGPSRAAPGPPLCFCPPLRLRRAAGVPPLFAEAIASLAGVWSEPDFVRGSTPDHQKYVYWGLREALRAFRWGRAALEATGAVPRVLAGVQARLDGAEAAPREHAMRVAELLSRVLDPASPLSFDEEAERAAEQEAAGPDAGAAAAGGAGGGGPVSPASIGPGGAAKAVEEEEAAGLTPYDLSEPPTRAERRKAPQYVGDLLRGLQSTRAEEWDALETALLAAEPLVRSGPPRLRENARALARALVNVPDIERPGCGEARQRALVALVAAQPDETVPLLAELFYGESVTTGTRLELLDALAAAAEQLAALPAPAPAPAPSPALPAAPGTPARDAVAQRLEAKTRRFGRGPQQPPPVVGRNRFAPLLPLFFYSLLSEYDRGRAHLRLLGEDHLLLARLLHTLGTFLELAGPSVPPQHARAAAAAALQLAWALRLHAEAAVRRSLLYAAAAALALPPAALIPALAPEIAQLREWLEEAAEGEGDPLARALAGAGLQQMLALLEAAGFAHSPSPHALLYGGREAWQTY